MLRITNKIAAGLFFIFALFSTTLYAQPIDQLLHQANDPIAGNSKGAVTVVEFFDYQCSHCVNMAPVIANIIRANSNVRIVFKELPIRGEISVFAARAALAANKQGKYYQFNHALMTMDEMLTKESILQKAGELGINVKKLKQDMNSSSITRQLESNAALANALQINGTPAFFIAKTNSASNQTPDIILGEMTQSELQAAISKAAKN